MTPSPHALAARARALARLAVAAALLAAPAGADRLPLRGGRWIETLGAWRIEGARVVFRSAAGGLRSLPLAEVDLAPRAGVEAAASTAPPATEYPWGRAREIRSPPPLPRPPGPRRPARPPAPPRCRLVNAGANLDPGWVCASRPPGAGRD